METSLELMWDCHRDYLKRILIGLTRDIDLADDLLQETYINASSGISRFRGGDERAWLAAIAKNAFLGHARRNYVRREKPFCVDEPAEKSMTTGTTDHLKLLDLRRAMAELKPDLRTALIMKHYGGFNYSEIGRHQGCPEGTARRRVWTAIRKLRAALSPVEGETTIMKCSQLRGTLLLDFVYGALPEAKADKIRQHLDECSKCRGEAEELRKLVGALDSAEGSYKLSRIVDINAIGMPTEYDWWSYTAGQDMDVTWWTVNKDHCVDYITIQGEEVVMEVLPSSDTQYKYQARLPRPVKQGESIPEVFVTHPKGPGGWAAWLEDGLWRYSHATCPNTAKEWVMILAVRLPDGAKLVSAEPQPTETRTNGPTTLVWRSLLPALWPSPPPEWTSRWQFECTIDYQLKTDGPVVTTDDTPSEWAKTHLKWAPDVVFEANDLDPLGGDRDRALDLFRKTDKIDLKYWITWFRLGMALWYVRAYDESMQAFQRVIEAGEIHIDFRLAAYVWRGQLLDELGRREEALKEYQHALDLNPGDGDYMQHSRIDAFMNREWIEDRLKTPYRRVPDEVIEILRTPDHPEDCERARSLYLKVFDYTPAWWEFWMHLGKMMWNCSFLEEALDCAKRLYDWTTARPKHRRSHVRMASLVIQGQILDTLGRREEALHVYQEALTVEPEGGTRHPWFQPEWVDQTYVKERLKTPFVREQL